MTSAQFSKEEGFFGILLAAAAVDGDISAAELQEIGALASRTKTLGPVTGDAFDKLQNNVLNVLKSGGVAELFRKSAVAIPANMSESVFAHACDILFADGEIREREAQYMDVLCQALNIEVDRARAIVAVLQIKNAS
jgi:tellurite resistance protein